MLSIALFEILNGVCSPAQWYRDATSRDQCKLLGQGISPSRSTWYEFRDRASKFVQQVHQKMITDGIQQGLVDPSECSLDGTFNAASTSRLKMYNLKQLSRRINQLKRAIRKLDNPLQVASKKTIDVLSKWVGATAIGRLRQLKSFRNAKARLLEKVGKNRAKHARFKREESKFSISPADSDAVIGKDKLNTIRPLYNIQYMTDNQSEVIVDYGVFMQSNDNGLLIPMLEKARKIVGQTLKKVFADSAYCSILDLKDSRVLGIELFAPVQDNQQVQRKAANGETQISSHEFDFTPSPPQMKCPQGHPMNLVRIAQIPRADGRRLGAYVFEQTVDLCSKCSLAGSCLGPKSKRRTISRQAEQDVLDMQVEKMNTPEGKQSQKVRSQVSERRFADGKQHRGNRILHGRAKKRAEAQVGLVVIAQNTLALFNLHKRQQKQQT